MLATAAGFLSILAAWGMPTLDDPTTTASEGFGLMFYNARWYDPYNSHFTQPDTTRWRTDISAWARTTASNWRSRGSRWTLPRQGSSDSASGPSPSALPAAERAVR